MDLLQQLYNLLTLYFLFNSINKIIKINMLGLSLIQIVIQFILIQVILSNSDNDESPPIICGKEKCEPKGGFCSPLLICKCYDDYTSTLFSIHQCDYKMISRFKAGLLEMVPGFGLGHFYALRKRNGAIKFFFSLVGIVCLFVSGIYIKEITEETEAVDHPYVSFFVLGTIVLILVVIVWNIIDVILFWGNCYKDGNGIIME